MTGSVARGVVVALAVVGVVAGCGPATAPVVDAPATPTAASASPSTTAERPTTPTRRTATATTTAPAGQAAAVLAVLAVRPPARRTGYNRADYGDYSTARAAVKVRDIAGRTTFTDPYTGRPARAADAEADHVVSLANAHDSGAYAWTDERKVTFARDTMNLLMVAGPVNAAKSDSAADEWLPPLEAARCEFVARQIAVKAVHDLSVTAQEKTAMARVLGACPGQTLPRDTNVAAPRPAPSKRTVNPAPSVPPATRPRTATPKAEKTTTSTRPTAARPAPDPTTSTREDQPVTFPNCAAARAAGAAPLHRGQPGYAARLDRDGDGVACE